MEKVKSFLPLILIIILASILRLVWLDRIPNAMGGDELDYILIGKAIALTGKDITGEWSPVSLLSFIPPPGQWMKGELPYLFIVPFIALTDFSLLAAKLPYAFVSILTVLLIYLITKRLFPKEKTTEGSLFGANIAVIAGFIAAINPWQIYIGRTAYDMSLAVFFYLCGFYILLISKGWRILLALPFLFLGFYSYIGTKVIFLPFIFVTVFYVYYFVNRKKFLWQYIMLLFFSTLLVIFFVFSLKYQTGTSRLTEILTPNNPEIVKQVDDARRMSIKTPLTNMLENKLTVFSKVIVTNFLRIFSTENLFLYGDNFFSVYTHGFFYYLDAIFLAFGLISLVFFNKELYFLLLSLIFIGTLPQVFHIGAGNAAHHISLVFPFLIIFIANGIWRFVQVIKDNHLFYVSLFRACEYRQALPWRMKQARKKPTPELKPPASALGEASFPKEKMSRASLLFIASLYILLLLNFLNIYFFQHSLKGYFDFPVRIVSKYLALAQEDNQSVIFMASGHLDPLRKYLFYSNSYNRQTAMQIKQLIRENEPQIGGIKFIPCNPKINFNQKNVVVIQDVQCDRPENLKHLSISRLSDGGEVYRIYNDALCGQYELARYPTNIALSDFNVERLPKERFCKKFISKL